MRRFYGALALILLFWTPGDGGAVTFVRGEYFLFKPSGNLLFGDKFADKELEKLIGYKNVANHGSFGSEFSSAFFGGFGVRQPVGPKYHAFFHAGYSRSHTAILVMRSDIQDPAEAFANVSTTMIPFSVGFGIAPMDVDLKGYLALGLGGLMTMSKYDEKGPVPAGDIPLKGFGIGPMIDIGVFGVNSSNREVSLSFRYHSPTFTMEEPGLRDRTLKYYQSTSGGTPPPSLTGTSELSSKRQLSFWLITITIGTGLGAE